MPRVEYAFDGPDRFVTGTVGEPGARTFFLQARLGSRITSVACEKEQVMALAERLDAMLDEVARREGRAAVAFDGVDDSAPLDQPIDEEFRAGTMTLAWETEPARVVIEVFSVETEVTPPDDDADGDETEGGVSAAALEALTQPASEAAGGDPEPELDGEVLVVRLSEQQARGFARRAVTVVSAGRPSCPFCGQPIDPNGHICPRANGYRRRG